MCWQRSSKYIYRAHDKRNPKQCLGFLWKRFKKRTHRVRNLRNDDDGGFDVRNLRNMRAFYRAFPKWNAVRSELTWTHNRILLRVEDDADRRWYRESASNPVGQVVSWSDRFPRCTMTGCSPAATRQKLMRYEDEDFYLDLVFYHSILKCHMLIDLKIGKLTHGDVGQMDSYIRMFDALYKNDDDNPTIGIILCSQKNEAIVKYSVLNDAKQVFASKYRLTLPSAEELQRQIEEERRRIEEQEDARN